MTVRDLQQKLEQNAQLERETAARVRAEAERDEARELLQAVMDGLGDPLVLIGADCRVRLANQAARDGYFPGEGGEPWHCYQISHHRDTPCDGTEHPCPLEQVRESLRPVTVVHEHARQDGEKRLVEISASPLLGQDGTLTGIVELARDVTERVQAGSQRDATLEALRESEEKFAKAFHSHPGLMAITRLTDGRIVAVNDSFVHSLGYSRKELVGRSTVELDLWAEPEERSRFTKSLQEHERVRDLEVQVRTKSGEIRLMLFAGDIIVLNHEPHLITVASDVTERVRAEAQRDATLEALRESEERWRALAENAPERITSLDRDGTILFINRTAPGRTPGQVIGTNVYNYLPPDERDKLRQTLKAVFELGKTERYEAVVVRADGARMWYENSVAPIKHDGRIVAAIIIATDITERVQAEDQIKAALAEKVVLLREVHHRVKNNLQVLVYLIDMQAETVEDPAALRAFGALQGRVRAMSLVHEKLYQTGDLAQVDFGDYLDDLTANLFHALGGGRAIALHVDAAGLSIGVNVAIPCGLMVNELVTNALKHAFPEEDRDRDRDREIRVEFGLQKGEYVLVVSDNGVGLPPGLDWRAGESLGLRMVNIWATHQLGGSIELGSGFFPGQGQRAGTTFEIRFPKRK